MIVCTCDVTLMGLLPLKVCKIFHSNTYAYFLWAHELSEYFVEVPISFILCQSVQLIIKPILQISSLDICCISCIILFFYPKSNTSQYHNQYYSVIP